MENEKLPEKFEQTLRLAIFVAKLRDTSAHDHKRRIRFAKKILDLANRILAYEIRKATSAPEGSEEHMSWAEIADALEMPKTTAYNRYGKNAD